MGRFLHTAVAIMVCNIDMLMAQDQASDGSLAFTWPKDPPAHWVRYHLAHPDPKTHNNPIQATP
jgi:hypothetical protein